MKRMSSILSRRKPQNSKAIWKFINVGVVALLPIILVLGVVLGSFSPALAQGVEEEPNNPCTSSQDFGAVALPFTVDGSLDTPPDTPPPDTPDPTPTPTASDVDFFMFTGTPNDRVVVDLEGEATGKGTLTEPLLGFFDSDCNLIALDEGLGTSTRLVITIPSDGIFILAAASYPDYGFTGNGFYSGSYQMTISPFVAAGSISGRVVDAETEEPLRGDVTPFAFVELYRCFDSECFEFVNFQSTDSEGRFLFNSDFAGNPLEVGTYQVVASAEQYQRNQTAPFEVGEGEDKDIGDIPLTPSFLQFVEVQPCSDLTPLGGTCEYSFRVRNNSSTTLEGAVWSIIDSSGIGSFVCFTVFQTGRYGAQTPAPREVSIGPGESRVLRFQFQVPGTVANGAFICTQAYLAQFCISKGVTGFSIVPENKARRMLQQLRWTR
ncbi:MAG TPA: carboxypeptidase-like regulatory domain-containing protein [Thermodesulfobacteriota bacterium]|nr:carboxypeptidase-like regulatory domain-containing protein [Thermodesulfobacteriota bacterium]